MSFHTNYAKWLEMGDPAHCPVCRDLPMPPGMVEVIELPHAWLTAEPIDCLKGACHLTAKQHVLELYELSAKDLFGLMKDLQSCAKALHYVTRAVKINYEIHGNSLPHLHIHIYPRYLDDPFPGQPINYHSKRNWYAGGEFEEFVQAVRASLLNQPVEDAFTTGAGRDGSGS
jgi:diadenosine tetraphosphate (Ap4A) HIT family hydrolase